MNIALSAKIRGENSLLSSPDKVGAALSRYTYIKPCLNNIIRCLEAYLVANYHERLVGDLGVGGMHAFMRLERDGHR